MQQTWKEAAAVYFDVLTLDLHGGTEECHAKVLQRQISSVPRCEHGTSGIRKRTWMIGVLVLVFSLF